MYSTDKHTSTSDESTKEDFKPSPLPSSRNRYASMAPRNAKRAIRDDKQEQRGVIPEPVTGSSCYVCRWTLSCGHSFQTFDRCYANGPPPNAPPGILTACNYKSGTADADPMCAHGKLEILNMDRIGEGMLCFECGGLDSLGLKDWTSSWLVATGGPKHYVSQRWIGEVRRIEKVLTKASGEDWVLVEENDGVQRADSVVAEGAQKDGKPGSEVVMS